MKIKFLITIFFLAAALSFSQGWMNGGRSGNFNPDSLKSITISGKVIADSLMMNGMYYLDINNDNNADYILILGPYWYKPDSSLAVRPKVGDLVTISGGLFTDMMNYIPMIVVYTINGNFWRSSTDAFWNNMGRNSMMGGMNHSGMGYSFGWNHDSLEAINLNGTILIDSTFMYGHYYIDINGDGTPDYFLNFGPPWYKPSSGAVLPKGGDNISISGWAIKTNFMNMIIINKINGEVWFDSSQINNNMGSGWIHKGMGQMMKFSNPFDSTDWMEVKPGWQSNGMGGGMMSADSFYCQILQVFPGDVPGDSIQNIMSAFEIGLFNPDGSNAMMQSESMGGRMKFNSMVNFQFHFDSAMTGWAGFNPTNIKVKCWNNQNDQWEVVTNPTLSSINNTVTISQAQVSNFYIVTADNSITGIRDNKISTINNFSLNQNYPNPFNPSTTIEFSVKENSTVTLSVYNILGQKTATLLNGAVTAGIHKIQFDASHLSSGVYFYKLTAGANSKVMKMLLLK
jgi:hypothetical protein